MAQTENFSVREAERLCPRLRNDLNFSVQEQGGRRVCVIEDASASRFHRVGLEEYRFIRMLDGSRTFAVILASLAREGGDAFTEREALQVLRWLKDQNLLAVESARSGSNDREHGEKMWKTAATWLNPLICKLPLIRPDAFFNRVEPRLRPALGKVGFAVWMIIIITGIFHVSINWNRFTHDSGGLFARDNWLWLFLAWVGLKVAHEFSHGLFCKHYGASVREAGVIFILFMPMGYIDATACLGIASRWKRIMVAFAGLYIEFFIAAIAAVVWANTGVGSLNNFAHNVVITGTVLTLFFNANPLMRFDGYFILSDLLEIPNLATRGRLWAHKALNWLLIGSGGITSLRPKNREDWIVAVYGVAAWFWQWIVLVGLIMAASVTLRGGGIIFAVMAAVAWVGMPLWRFLSSLGGRVAGGGGSWKTPALRIGGLLGLGALVLFMPWHRTVSGDGVVEMADTTTLRAECPGFISKELVKDGDRVEEGQVLIEMVNDEVASELARSRLLLAQQELRARLAYTRGDVATFQAEQSKTEALQKSGVEQQRYYSSLQIKAPFSGRVTTRSLGQREGVFFKEGEELLQIGRASGSELKLAINERDEPHFREALQQPLRIRISGRGVTLDGNLERIEARGSRENVHPALLASSGGPLALRPSDRSRADETSQKPAYELVEPHFTAVAAITNGEKLAPGEMARVKFRGLQTVTLWSELQTAIAQWLRRYTTQ